MSSQAWVVIKALPFAQSIELTVVVDFASGECTTHEKTRGYTYSICIPIE